MIPDLAFEWKGKGLLPALALLGAIVTACSIPAVPSTTTRPLTTTSVSLIATTSPVVPPTSRPEESNVRTRVQLINPATLEPVASSVEVPGYLSPEHVVLPDGRLVLLSWVGEIASEGLLTLLDPDTGVVETISSRFTSGVRLVGYSQALDRVILIDEVGARQPVYFDPASMTFDTRPFHDTIGEEAVFEWASETALFDAGRKLALYSQVGYEVDRIGSPPIVTIADLEKEVLGDPIEITGAVHGLVKLPPDLARNPSWPYGEVTPGVAFDVVVGRLFVAHADGAGLTVVDLMTESVEEASFSQQPSFWTKTLSWLIPAAEGKGSEPSATLSAWLSEDGSHLFVTGVANDAWREQPTRALHTSTTPLGLTVIDTEALEVVVSIDLPVTQGVSTRNAIALAGSSGNLVFCDEVCDRDNTEPVVEGEPRHSGLYVLDPVTFEVRSHHRPGANFYSVGAFDHWLVTESFGDDGDFYETIDLVTGTPAARVAYSSSTYIITEVGILEVRYLG